MSDIAETIREQFGKGDAIRDAGNTTPADVERHDNILYGSDPKWQILDVYRPKNHAGKLPVIISYHGGGWVYGTKEVYQWYCMSLAQRGFAVINYTYRLAPEFKYPAPLEDCALVIKWMQAHSEKFGFDLDHVFGVGDSAGGNGLGLFACILSNPDYARFYPFAPKDFHFTAIALNCGAYGMDENDPNSLDMQIMKIFLPECSHELLERMNVHHWITAAYPPVFLMTADGDFLKKQAGELANTLLEENVPFAFHFYKGKNEPLPHVFHCNVKTADAARCNDDECAFFKSFLKD